MDHCNEKEQHICSMVLFLVWVYVMHSTYFGRVVVKVETLFQTH